MASRRCITHAKLQKSSPLHHPHVSLSRRLQCCSIICLSVCLKLIVIFL